MGCQSAGISLLQPRGRSHYDQSRISVGWPNCSLSVIRSKTYACLWRISHLTISGRWRSLYRAKHCCFRPKRIKHVLKVHKQSLGWMRRKTQHGKIYLKYIRWAFVVDPISAFNDPESFLLSAYRQSNKARDPPSSGRLLGLTLFTQSVFPRSSIPMELFRMISTIFLRKHSGTTRRPCALMH